MTLELSEHAHFRSSSMYHTCCISLDSIGEDILRNPFYFPGSVVAGPTKPKRYNFLKANTLGNRISPKPFSGVAINQHLSTITLLVKLTTVSTYTYQYLAGFKQMEPQPKRRNCVGSPPKYPEHDMKQHHSCNALVSSSINSGLDQIHPPSGRSLQGADQLTFLIEKHHHKKSYAMIKSP